MPKRMTDPKRRTGRRKRPSVNEYQSPHSPFQKLIDAHREQLGLSWRDLGRAIGKHPSSVWIWAHNKNGYPAPRNCGEPVLTLLAKTLQINLDDLKRSLDASRHIATPKETPMPLDVVDPFETLEATLVQIKAPTIRTAYILDLVRRLRPKHTAQA